MATKHDGIALEFGLGQVIPIIGVQHNPTSEWMAVVWSYFQFSGSDKKHVAPHYADHLIEAVIMGSNLELADPTTARFCIEYKSMKWPDRETYLYVFELEDGTLWEVMTSDAPASVYPGQSFIEGRRWQDDWLLRSKADKCCRLIGPNATMLYLVRRITPQGLRLHESRFLQEKK